MRILMLVSEAPPIKSGIARVAGKLTEGLRARGLQVDTLSANEIPRWTFKEFRLSALALRWPAIQQRLAGYDILHIHGTVPTFSDAALVFGRMAQATRYPNLGIVYTHHSDIDIAGLGVPVTMYNGLHYQLVRLADHLVASTPSYAMQLEASAPPLRVSAVGFGVDSQRFQHHGPKAPRFTVLFVGQLRPYKGVDVLLRAWRHVTNADLHIVGDGHERAALQALVRDFDLQNVHFHGSVSDAELREFYAAAHVLVLPSTTRAEAFGLVLLEGMSARCVPVASALPGVSDVVGNAGYTYAVNDSVMLAQILRRLRDNPAERAAVAERAAARAVAAAWDYSVNSYVGVYQQVALARALSVASRGRPPTPAVLQGWMGRLAEVAGADRASLMLTDPDQHELRMVAGVGIDPAVADEIHLPLGQRMAGFVAQTGRPLLIRPRGTPALARIYGTRPELRSSLILPLGPPESVPGVLNLARRGDRLAFTEEDQRWLQRLALQVGRMLQPNGPARTSASTGGPAIRRLAAQLRRSLSPAEPTLFSSDDPV